MKQLPLLTGKELGKIIVKIGYKYDHTSGSHMTFTNFEEHKKITIPNHGSEPIRPGLLLKIIKKDLGITKEEFFKLLK
ncbi:MAG TPA: type II toxin-antitoxin system HicA family toxin [archaeon]|nr:type II toxin-antitoxin system HicA family toxin [archaeon]